MLTRFDFSVDSVDPFAVEHQRFIESSELHILQPQPPDICPELIPPSGMPFDCRPHTEFKKLRINRSSSLH